MNENIYYGYLYSHPDTMTPFYAGYGKDDRMYDHLSEARRPNLHSHKLHTIRKIIAEGKQPVIRIIDDNLNKDEACELEEFLIEYIGRADLGTGPLTNLTKGGDGNRDWTPENRKHMSAVQSGTISVKDKDGNKFRVKSDDTRWLSGELVGQNLGTVNSNINGKLNNYIIAKNPITNEKFRVKPTDPRWISGELVGVMNGVKCHPNTLKAGLAKKGIAKSADVKKNMKWKIQRLWYHNFDTNETCRIEIDKEIPLGFVRVSGPHKKEIL